MRGGIVICLGILGSAFASLAQGGSLPLPPVIWERHGNGMVRDIGVLDTDDPGDGIGEIIVGGRGGGLLTERSLGEGRYAWLNRWDGLPGPVDEGETTQELATGDFDGDGLPEILLAADAGLVSIDATTGATEWSVRDDPEEQGSRIGAWNIAVADFDGDGGLDVAYADLIDTGVTFVNADDGSPLGFYSRADAVVLDMEAGDLDGDGQPELVVVGQPFGAGSSEVHAIRWGPVSAAGPLTLWTQRYPASNSALPPLPVGGPQVRDPVSVTIGTVRASGGPSVVVGGLGTIDVLAAANGSLQAQAALEQSWYAYELRTQQLDADAPREIVAGLNLPHHIDPKGRIAAFEGDATALWNKDTDGDWVFDLDEIDLGGERPATLAAVGDTRPNGDGGPSGRVLAIKASTAAEPEMVFDTPVVENAAALAIGDTFGGRRIAVGHQMPAGEGGGVSLLRPDGPLDREIRGGGRIADVAVHDLDGDGTPEVLEAANDSYVAAHNADGTVRWQQRVPHAASPDVTVVAAGDLDPARTGDEVVAGTWEFDGGPARGWVHAFGADGKRLWSRGVASDTTPGSDCPVEVLTVTGSIADIKVTDADADGAADIFVMGRSPGLSQPCGVAARYDAAGMPVWVRTVPVETGHKAAVWDLNGDGIKDFMVTRNGFQYGGVYALDGETGEPLWTNSTVGGVGWIEAGPEGILVGGRGDGVIVQLGFDGSERWRAVFDATIYRGTWDGEYSVDVNGDGVRDIATAHNDSRTRMLDGTNGELLWEADGGGPYIYRLATLYGGEKPVIALGLGLFNSREDQPGWIDFLDARTGEAIAARPALNAVFDLAPGDIDGDGVDDVAASAGWTLPVLRSGVAPEAEVTPTPTPTPTETPTATPTETPPRRQRRRRPRRQRRRRPRRQRRRRPRRRRRHPPPIRPPPIRFPRCTPAAHLSSTDRSIRAPSPGPPPAWRRSVSSRVRSAYEEGAGSSCAAWSCERATVAPPAAQAASGPPAATPACAGRAASRSACAGPAAT